MLRRLCTGFAVFAASILTSHTINAADDPKTELAKKAQGILKTHCYKCHGEAGAVEGGMNYIVDLDRLVVRKKVIPNKAEASPVYKRIVNETMPPPDVTARVSDAEKAILKQWIDGGAGHIQSATPFKFISQTEMQEMILADLEKIDRRSRRFIRYFTFAHLHNAGLGDDEVQTYRNSLNKLVNSLSWHPKIRNPEPIDPAGSILRIDLRWYMWDATLWNRILNEYPYGLLDDTTPARAIMVSTATKVPLLRGDWFVATASRPPLYQDILQLPANLAELERQLRVDAAQNILQERVIRLAFNGSGISKNNRILERHDSVHGYYWRTYDFEEVPQNLIERGTLLPDRRNVFAYPLGPGNVENAFQHIGGEAIFSLPNGLQGYYIMNSVNNRLDKAATAIVSDPKRPDRAVEMGISCMGCHIPGIHTKADQMHEHLQKNPKAIPKADAEIAKALYPPKEKSFAQMEEDAKKYREAVIQTGAKIAKAEPIITMTLRYESDLDATVAAAETGLKLEEFQKRIAESELLSRNLGALRVPGGTVGRQIWVQSFGDLVKELKLGVLFQANQVGAQLPDNTGELDPLEVAVGQSNHMVFSPDGRRAVVASADRTVQYYEVEGKRVLKRLVGHTASVWCVALSKDGAYALSGGMDGTVRLWKVEEAQQLLKIEGHASLVTAVAFTPDGKKAISGGFDGAVIFWDLTTGKEIKRLENKEIKYVNSVAVSPDGKKALIGADKFLRLWDLDSGNEIRKFEGHFSAVNAVCFSFDGKKALSGSDDRSVRLWDVESGKQEQLFTGHEAAVRAVAFNEKGNWALSGGADASVRLWQTATGKELGKFTKHTEPIVRVAFLDNGKQTLTGSRDNAQLYWSIERFYPAPKVDPKVANPDYPKVLELKPTAVAPVEGTVSKLILSPNRKWLFYMDVTNGKLGQIDAATGKATKSIKVEGDLLTISPDGKTLFVGGPTSGGKGAIAVIDPVSLNVRGTVPLDFAPFDLTAASEKVVLVSGDAAGWTSIGLVDAEKNSTNYIAPTLGRAYINWLPGRLLAHADGGAESKIEELKLPVEAKKVPAWNPSAVQLAGPALVTSDYKFLITRAGSVHGLSGYGKEGDLKPAAKIDSFLSLAVDAELATAYLVNSAGWLKRFSYPDWKEQAKWKLPLTAYQIAVDAKAGKLFLCVIDPAALRDRPRAKGFGDIWQIDVKDLAK